jgi:hypothetical protein
MFEPCLQGRELCHSCDLCGDLPILGVRRSCDVCDDFGACRSRRSVSEQARASIAEAQISPPTNRASRRTPLDAAPRPRRERAILTRFRLVAFTSCPFQTGAVRSNGAIPRTSFAVVRLSLENENAKTPLLF